MVSSLTKIKSIKKKIGNLLNNKSSDVNCYDIFDLIIYNPQKLEEDTNDKNDDTIVLI